MMRKLAVLASGLGTLLEAIAAQLPVGLVLADRPCRAFDHVAPQLDIPRVLLQRDNFTQTFDRYDYTALFINALLAHHVRVILMDDFQTIFADPIFNFFSDIFNTHPSLLPRFKGPKAVADALEAGEKETGCTIYRATVELYAGPILAQGRVPILPGDTVEKLHERIKTVEFNLYPKVLRSLMWQDN